MINAAKKASEDLKPSVYETLSQELAYLLNIRSHREPIKIDDKPYLARALKHFQEISGDYLYNEQVMIAILGIY